MQGDRASCRKFIFASTWQEKQKKPRGKKISPICNSRLKSDCYQTQVRPNIMDSVREQTFTPDPWTIWGWKAQNRKTFALVIPTFTSLTRWAAHYLWKLRSGCPSAKSKGKNASQSQRGPDSWPFCFFFPKNLPVHNIGVDKKK